MNEALNENIIVEAENQEPSNQPIDLETLREDVNKLRDEIAKRQIPWYKNPSVIISLVALLFSFGTTFVSYIRIQNQDIQSDRVELRGLLQRLNSLPLEQFELTQKYKDDQRAIVSIGSLVNQETTLLSRQAAEIASKIPSQYVSATEYITIGFALQNAYNNENAEILFKKAIDVSTDFVDKVTALRSLANLLFIMGQPENGRVYYQRSLNIFADFNDFNSYTINSTHIYTEISWAYAEANIGNIEQAKQHIANAENYHAKLLPGPGSNQLDQYIKKAKKEIELGQNSSIDSTITPLNTRN